MAVSMQNPLAVRRIDGSQSAALIVISKKGGILCHRFLTIVCQQTEHLFQISGM